MVYPSRRIDRQALDLAPHVVSDDQVASLEPPNPGGTAALGERSNPPAAHPDGLVAVVVQQRGPCPRIGAQWQRGGNGLREHEQRAAAPWVALKRNVGKSIAR